MEKTTKLEAVLDKHGKAFDEYFHKRARELFPETVLNDEEIKKVVSKSKQTAQNLHLLLIMETPLNPKLHQLISEIFAESIKRAPELAGEVTDAVRQDEADAEKDAEAGAYPEAVPSHPEAVPAA